jgi:hypothetical protein
MTEDSANVSVIWKSNMFMILFLETGPLEIKPLVLSVSFWESILFGQ